MCFYCFYGFNWDFLKFPSVNSSKIFTTHRFQRDKNFKHEKSSGCKGSFLDFFFKFMPALYHCENTGLIGFPKKTRSD